MAKRPIDNVLAVGGVAFVLWYANKAGLVDLGSIVRGFKTVYQPADARAASSQAGSTSGTAASGGAAPASATSRPYSGGPVDVAPNVTSGTVGKGSYTVQPGDTLGALAAQFGTSVDALAQANGIINPDLIYAGSTLRIPTA